MCHVNLIPLNPTVGFAGRPSDELCSGTVHRSLLAEYGVPATVCVRRGYHIDAGRLSRTKAKCCATDTEIEDIV